MKGAEHDDDDNDDDDDDDDCGWRGKLNSAGTHLYKHWFAPEPNS